MNKVFDVDDQVEISSDESSLSDMDNDVVETEVTYDEPPEEISREEWLFRKANTYQEYMKTIPIPMERVTTLPYTSWVDLGYAIKQMYGQPLHYLTNIHLKRLDEQRHGADHGHDSLDTIIHPILAESSIWLIEEVHRCTSSPLHLFELWKVDEKYDESIDEIIPKLGQ